MADQVRAAHLLIKHAGSRNPVSRRTGAPVTLAPADALAELRSYEDRIWAEGVATAFPTYGERAGPVVPVVASRQCAPGRTRPEAVSRAGPADRVGRVPRRSRVLRPPAILTVLAVFCWRSEGEERLLFLQTQWRLGDLRQGCDAKAV